jgi:deoxyxylulose-5-phosphate synthase
MITQTESLLDTLVLPEDVKSLNNRELRALAREIRAFLVECV